MGLLWVMAACSGGRKNADSQEQTIEMDSMVTIEDTLFVDDFLEEELIIPARADENFEDFLYNFMLDEKLQISRIKFPLPYYTDNQKDSIVEETWEYDPLLSSLESYMVMYDRKADMDLAMDTTLVSTQIEWYSFKEHKRKRHYFERIDGDWMLEAIDYATMVVEEGDEEDFYAFYERFVNDSVFQAERVLKPLTFITLDPEDEFQLLETTLELGQWFAFKPPFPKDYLTNVNYGQRLDRNSRNRIVELKGAGDQFYNVFYFQRRNGIWKLIRYEDLGD